MVSHSYPVAAWKELEELEGRARSENGHTVTIVSQRPDSTNSPRFIRWDNFNHYSTTVQPERVEATLATRTTSGFAYGAQAVLKHGNHFTCFSIVQTAWLLGPLLPV